jgi:E3 ubiquitin-protein ligase HERC2
MVVANGDIYLWGSGKEFKLGNQSEDDIASVSDGLLKFEFTGRPVQISCGYDHSGVLTDRGCIFTWGGNDFGQLGLGDQNIRSSPSEIDLPFISGKVKSFSFGAFHCICMTQENDVYSWGFNDKGQLGNGTILNQSRPKLIFRLRNKNVDKVLCSGNFTVFLTSKFFTCFPDF